jgi:hypothetical protein
VFFTAIHGIRRRSAASASRARVIAFSLSSSWSHAACHSCGDTTAGALAGSSLSLLFVSMSDS